jgi:hypothetical protein
MKPKCCGNCNHFIKNGAIDCYGLKFGICDISKIIPTVNENDFCSEKHYIKETPNIKNKIC